ncbi:MAG: acyl-CoA thioesterase [Saprospiraceae bacterium]|nr:acyl-CoA thioesterase [Saprospiraceae bacterium]MDW8484343.1 thioesterase family protein [Saprospiraceae bacterium]
MQPLFQMPISVRWADLDPNGHVRHSVYYDWGASVRIACLAAHGLTLERMAAEGFGPVLLREEAVFRREVRLGDELTIHLWLTNSRPDGSRFTFRHDILRSDGTLCAVITIEGGWIDLHSRKLISPPAGVIAWFAQWLTNRDLTSP